MEIFKPISAWSLESTIDDDDSTSPLIFLSFTITKLHVIPQIRHACDCRLPSISPYCTGLNQLEWFINYRKHNGLLLNQTTTPTRRVAKENIMACVVRNSYSFRTHKNYAPGWLRTLLSCIADFSTDTLEHGYLANFGIGQGCDEIWSRWCIMHHKTLSYI